MKTRKLNKQNVTFHYYHTVIVGAGAAGMNCAKKLYEFMTQAGVGDAQKRIAVVTAGLPLGASRMSGSDKQTYYKMGTSSNVADSAESFAASLTAGGCCHGDLAMAEAIGSLRGFYHLVEAGVSFPHDSMGSYIGYKTDHDPYERATSAGPKTSKFMSECLQCYVERYGIAIHDHQEAVELITAGDGDEKRIIALAAIDRKKLTDDDYGLNVFCAENFVLAAGGPGALYETSVYPKGQVGIHGLAFKAGLAAENLTESQFGLASTQFRWNVSGTYMQAVPRLYSTEANGGDEREFLPDFFPSMSKMATDIFLKGYQWPFDPQRIENHQSSLIDVLVFNETQQGRRVFMDFLHNPVSGDSMKAFYLNELETEALSYLQSTGAMQARPIERLAHMNPLAIEIYRENGIDLYREPLEIAVCAQHNNGGFAVDRWWQSNVKHTFVIGEMAGTHGVKRPGGSALNAGQVGACRAADYIANVYCRDMPGEDYYKNEINGAIERVISRLNDFQKTGTLDPDKVIEQIQHRMTTYGGHIREQESVRKELAEAVELYRRIKREGCCVASAKDFVTAVQAKHLALASAGYLKAIAVLLAQGSGSRGSHLVIDREGVEIHRDVRDPATDQPLRYKPENTRLRDSILRVRYDFQAEDLFVCENVPVRTAPADHKAFEPAWQDYREGRIYR